MPRWLHGDLAPTNLPVKNGDLPAVIDFGCCGVGDPAGDPAIAWTFFDTDQRGVFRSTLGIDDGTWRRGSGWALWKAMIVLAGLPGTDLTLQSATILAQRSTGYWRMVIWSVADV